MRFTRLLGALLATVLIGGLGLVSAPSAGAADASAPAAEKAGIAQRASVTVIARAKNRGRSVFLVGKVKPRKGPVVIQRATKCGNTNCNFKLYKKIGTNKKGRFSVRTPSRAGGDYFYRARVGSSVSATYRVFRV